MPKEEAIRAALVNSLCESNLTTGELIYTIKEAAEITRMSIPWWRQRIFRKEIKHLRIGRRVFIPASVIEHLFQNGIVEPSQKGTA